MTESVVISAWRLDCNIHKVASALHSDFFEGSGVLDVGTWQRDQSPAVVDGP